MSRQGGGAIVAIVWVTLAVAYGLFFSFSVFLVPLVEEFRWSRAFTAGALSLSTVIQGICAPLVGVIVDRIGPRPVILTGVVMLGGAALLSSTVHEPWHLYLYTGVLGGLGLVGVGWVPMAVLLSRRFSERRGRVVGIAFSGMGIGVFVLGPLAQWLIDVVGWRAATTLLGAGALVLLVPLVSLGLRSEPRPWYRAGGLTDVGGGHAPAPSTPAPRRSDPDATLGDALRTPQFWALFAAYFLTPLAVFPVATHQVAFAVDVGFTPLFAASVFGIMGLMSSVGRPVFGVAADRFGGPISATVSFGCTAAGALSLLALEASPRPAWLIAYAILFGLGFGARGPIVTSMTNDLFGGRRFGVIYGAVNLGNGMGGALGPWFGGFVHDVTGSYRVAFLASVVFSVAGATCFWLARRRSP
jgi:MFS family permease